MNCNLIVRFYLLFNLGYSDYFHIDFTLSVTVWFKVKCMYFFFYRKDLSVCNYLPTLSETETQRRWKKERYVFIYCFSPTLNVFCENVFEGCQLPAAHKWKCSETHSRVVTHIIFGRGILVPELVSNIKTTSIYSLYFKRTQNDKFEQI